MVSMLFRLNSAQAVMVMEKYTAIIQLARTATAAAAGQ